MDSGTTHNFLSMTVVDILKSTAPECISRWYLTETLHVSPADNMATLLTNLANVTITFNRCNEQEIRFCVVPRLKHPLILGLQ